MALSLKAILNLDGSGFMLGMSKAERAVNRFASSQLGGLKSAIAGAFTVGAIEEVGRKTIDWAKSIQVASDRLGVSTEWMQSMVHAVKEGGSDMEALVGFMEKLNYLRAEILSGTARGQKGSAVMQNAFGIAPGAWSSMGTQAIMEKIAKAFEHGASGPLIAALRQVGVKGAGALATTFSGGLEESRNEFKRLGGIVSDDVLRQLAAVKGRFELLADVLRANLAPAMLYFMQTMVAWVYGLKKNASFIGGGTGAWSFGDWIKNAIKYSMTGGVLGPMGAGEGAFRKILGLSSEQLEKAVDAATGTIFGALGMESPKKFDVKTASDEMSEVQKQFEAFMKKWAALAKPRGGAAPSLFTPAFTMPKPPMEKSDALLSVGNFLGSSRATIETIGTETNRILREHTTLLNRIASRPTHSFGDAGDNEIDAPDY